MSCFSSSIITEISGVISIEEWFRFVRCGRHRWIISRVSLEMAAISFLRSRIISGSSRGLGLSPVVVVVSIADGSLWQGVTGNDSKACLICVTAVVIISFSWEISCLSDAKSLAYSGGVVAGGCCVLAGGLGVLEEAETVGQARGGYSVDWSES